LHEEVNQKTIALTINTTKMTARVLKDLFEKYLEAQKQKEHNPYSQGKQSLKELVGQNAGVSNIEINDNNIKSFERIAKKYGIDYALKKDKQVDPPKYLVFFKGRDTDVLTMAFKEFVVTNEKKHSKESIREKLAHFKDLATKGKNRERSREQQKDRGQSL